MPLRPHSGRGGSSGTCEILGCAQRRPLLAPARSGSRARPRAAERYGRAASVPGDTVGATLRGRPAFRAEEDCRHQRRQTRPEVKAGPEADDRTGGEPLVWRRRTTRLSCRLGVGAVSGDRITGALVRASECLWVTTCGLGPIPGTSQRTSLERRSETASGSPGRLVLLQGVRVPRHRCAAPSGRGARRILAHRWRAARGPCW